MPRTHILPAHSVLRFEEDVSLYTKLRPTNLSTSSTRSTGVENSSTRSHSFTLSGVMLNTSAKNGTYKIMKCKPKLTNIATIRYGFTQGGICSRLPSSLSAFSALNISIATRTLSDSVLAFAFPTVKYSHGVLNDTRPPPEVLYERLGLNPFHDSHSPHVISCSIEMGVWPSPLRSMPMKFVDVYHAANAPTVAKPTYMPTTM
mmetsp:Transcript_4463/g.9986  ORF Transcript_4463/g.9986 Transcript_4463/m.9986 type:complete len:203 (-) Transcript_4463:1200-1808(-)